MLREIDQFSGGNAPIVQGILMLYQALSLVCSLLLARSVDLSYYAIITHPSISVVTDLLRCSVLKRGMMPATTNPNP